MPSEYALISILYSFPNIVFPLFGGLLFDKFKGYCRRNSSLSLAMNIFTLTMVIGLGVFCLGLSVNVFYLAIVGRFIMS